MYTYNPKNVYVKVNGEAIKGYAEDSFITISPKGEGTQSQTGCDGTVVRSIDVNKQVTVRLTLQQGSDSNKTLAEKFRADKKDASGAFKLEITELKDGVFETVLNSGEGGAWVQNHAEYTRGKNAGNQEWTLETGEVDF